MKKPLIILISIILSSNVCSFAQNQRPHQGIAEIQKKKIEFIKKRLQLTPVEEKKFIPVYQEYERKRGDIIKSRHEIFRSFNQNSLNLSLDDAQKMTDELVVLSTKEAKLFEEYNTKFKSILPPIKIMLLYISEHEFKKELLKKMKPPPVRH